MHAMVLTLWGAEWRGCWSYFQRDILPTIAHAYIKEVIKLWGRHYTDDEPFKFEADGLCNKTFRIFRKFNDDHIMAIYNHDGRYHIILAKEENYLRIVGSRINSMPKYK